jgi:hypothetical protein
MLRLAARAIAVSRLGRERLGKLLYSQYLRFVSNKYKEAWALFIWSRKILQKGTESVGALKENIPVICS